MLLSMTGYGSGHVDAENVSVVVEIRAVNNRYLKLHTRLPDGLAAIESRIEEAVRKQIRRGAVQLTVDVRETKSPEDYQLNLELLSGYVSQIVDLGKRLGNPDISAAHIDIAALLTLPGAIQDEQGKSQQANNHWEAISEALGAALKDIKRMREVEGRAMAEDLTVQLQDIEACADEIAELAPGVAEAYQTRLTDRLNKLLAQHDVQVAPADVVREVGVFAEKADISEEIVRLRSHLSQFGEIMTGSEAGAGRKLEFLVQELLRETNTIGSKANDAEIAKRVVHVKTCIERIREMVQNVE